MRDRGDERGVERPGAAMVRDRHRIGDHEEREEKERTAAEVMDEDRGGLAEPRDAGGERAEVAGEKRRAHVGPARPSDDEGAERHEPRRERDVGAPLARRHPCVRQKHEGGDGAEVGGVEEMLASPAKEEFPADRERGGERVDPERRRAQEQRQPEGGNDRAPQAGAAPAREPSQRRLRAYRGAERERDLARPDREVAKPGARGEQQTEAGDLEEPRVACPAAADDLEEHRHTPERTGAAILLAAFFG